MKLIPARKSHKKKIQELIQNLEAEVREEIRWISDQVPEEEAIRRCMEVSAEIWWGVGKAGEILCLFGVEKKVSSPYGRCVWCLTTTRAACYKKDYLRESKRIAREWIGKYGSLYNVIPLSYRAALKWAVICGARMKNIVTINGKQAMVIAAKREGK